MPLPLRSQRLPDLPLRMHVRSRQVCNTTRCSCQSPPAISTVSPTALSRGLAAASRIRCLPGDADTRSAPVSARPCAVRHAFLVLLQDTNPLAARDGTHGLSRGRHRNGHEGGARAWRGWGASTCSPIRSVALASTSGERERAAIPGARDVGARPGILVRASTGYPILRPYSGQSDLPVSARRMVGTQVIEFKICLVILGICPRPPHQIRARIPRDEAHWSPVFRGFPAFTRFFLISACPTVFLLACLYRQIPAAA